MMVTATSPKMAGDYSRSKSIDLHVNTRSSETEIMTSTIEANGGRSNGGNLVTPRTMSSSPRLFGNNSSSPAVESAVDAYASRLLKNRSPPEACIDSSLGPYVTSVLRCALSNNDHSEKNGQMKENFVEIGSLDEYDSLMELLEEHCCMNTNTAKETLQCIATAVRTGSVDAAFDDPALSMRKMGGSCNNSYRSSTGGLMAMTALGGGAYSFSSRPGISHIGNGFGLGGVGLGGIGRRFRSKSMGAEADYGDPSHSSIRLLGDMLRNGNLIGSCGTNTMNNGNNMVENSNKISQSSSSSSSPSYTINNIENRGDEDFSDFNPNHYSHLIHHHSLNGPEGIEEETSFLLEEDEMEEQQEQKEQFNNAQNNHNIPTNSDNIHSQESCTPMKSETLSSLTPLKPDRLIPVDLLGVIDDPSTPAGTKTLHRGQDQNMQQQQQKQKATSLSFSHNTMEPNNHVHSPQRQEKGIASAHINTTTTTATTTPTKTITMTNTKSISSTNMNIENKSQTNNTNSTTNISKKFKKKKEKNTDLAAALFCSSRSRSNSLQTEKSPKIKPLTAPPASIIGMAGLSVSSSSALMSNSIPALFQKQLDSAVQILLSMNYDLCEDAAHEAALVSNADVNLAQHVIDGAIAAPPVCRHMLHDGCYRSDCQYSHDVDGHTCSFWLRGRCGKGDSCRFMHGFSEKHLEGLEVDFLSNNQSAENINNQNRSSSQFSSPSHSSNGAGTAPLPIKTSNLLEHNMRSSFSLPINRDSNSSLSNANVNFNVHANTAVPAPNASALFSPTAKPFDPNALRNKSTSPDPLCVETHSLNMDGNCDKNLKLNLSASLDNGNKATPSDTNSITNKDDGVRQKTFSFANIATQGYSNKSFNEGTTSKSSPQVLSSGKDALIKTVKIPQDLWNSNLNRNSIAFSITDPMGRYKAVSATVKRENVIDLHFQSVKTFSVVLSKVLPEKLQDHGQVWVVTGSGHHVAKNSHQKSGGVLENVVIGWLKTNEYDFARGKDRNGHCGAFLVKR